MIFTDEHKQLRATVRRIVERDINPHCDAWEEAEQFPAHQLFPLLGKEGLLGITRSTDCGGQGLDWSFALVLAEELGRCRSAGVALAIGVQTDMCTPALDRFGSEELKREFLAPTIAGDYVACLGVSEASGGSDVAALKTAMVAARATPKTQVIVIDTTHTRTTEDGGWWWEVAIPEVSSRGEVRQAHAAYLAAKAAQQP